MVWWPPPATWASFSGWPTRRARAAATNRPCTIRVPWRAGAASRGAALLEPAKVQLATRSGNSARPDKTWSDWSEPLTDAQDSLIRSPNARYIQWRASLEGPGAAIENVSLAYLPQNNPPVIRSISVTMQSSAQKAARRHQFHRRGL